jgi:transposase InsO family protein
MVERMMSVVGGIASGKTPLPRSRGKKTKPEDPEPASPLQRLVMTMREANAPTSVCSRVLNVSESTVRRHARPKPPTATKPRPPDEARCKRVRDIVRATHGLAGARSLGKMCGLPRRNCAAIKRHELREMELERKAQCARVTIAAPGIVRGFDAMHVHSRDCKAYWLVAADGAVPFRTSITTVATYDVEHVIAALKSDFDSHGPPIVVRLDRIACQRTPEVEEFLAHHDVLALHGPPRHPYFYGQLERQNREHRAWYDLLRESLSMYELARAAEDMRRALNGLWSRPTLDGCTAEQAWLQRKPLEVNRRELLADVNRRTSGLVTSGLDLLRAQRIAIESALKERGLLTINHGGWC